MKHRVHLIQSLILATALFLGAGVLGPLRVEAHRRAETLKVRLIRHLESNLGITVRFGSISPALLSAVTVRNVEVSFPQGSFVADRIRVFYNPFRSLRRGDGDPSSLITRVAINTGHLSADFTSEGGGTSGNEANSSAIWRLLEAKTLVLDDFSSELLLDAFGTIYADDIALVLADDDTVTRYRFEGSVSTQELDILPALGPISMDLRSRGSFSPGESMFNGRFDIFTARSDLLTLKPMSADLTFSPGDFTLRRIDDALPMDISIRATTQGVSVGGEMADLVLNDIVEPGRTAESLRPWFDTVLNGSFSVDLDGDGFNPAYRVDMDARFSENRILPWPLAVNINASGNRNAAWVRRLKAAAPWGELGYAGAFRFDTLTPEGVLSLGIFDNVVGYPIDAAFEMKAVGDAISAEPVRFVAAGMQFHDFRFLLIRDIDRISVSLLAVPGRPDETARRRILVDALLDIRNSPVIHGFAQVEGFDASHVARFVGAKSAASLGFVEDSLFHLNGMFEVNADSWIIAVEQAGIVSRSNPENRITLRGRASPNRWSVDGVRISWNDFVADGRGSGRRSLTGGVAQGRIIIGEDLYPVEAEWIDGGNLTLTADSGFTAALGAKTLSGRSLTVSGAGVDLPVRDQRLLADFDLRGVVGRNDWEVRILKSRFTLTGSADDPVSALEFNGTISPGRIVFPVIRFSDSGGTLDGNAVFENLFGNEDFFGQFVLSSESDERYEMFAIRSGNLWDVDLAVENGRLERFGQTGLDGFIDLEGQLSGPLDDPVLTLEVNIREGTIATRPFELKGSANLDSGNLRIHDVVFFRDGVWVESSLALVDLTQATVRLTAKIKATYNQVPVSTGMSLAVDFDEGASLLNLQSLADLHFTGTLATRPVMWDNTVHWPGFTFQFVRNETEFQLRTPDADVLDLGYRFADGQLDILAGDPMPVTAVGGGTVVDGRIDLSFPSLSIDPVLINYVMLRDPILLQYHVVFQDGQFVGNLDIEGPIGSPDLYGTLGAVNLKVDTPYTYAGIRPASTDIHFQGNRIVFDRIEVPVGDGIAYAGGFIVLDSWTLADFDMIYGLGASSEGKGVPVYYPLLGVYLDGLATGEIRMRGNSQGLNLEGDIRFPYLKASLGSPRVPVKQRKTEKRPIPVSLDFALTTGNNFTFYLPNEQLKIVRATAEPDRTLNLIYSNEPRNLSVSGVLPIKSGDIFYFDRDFQVTQGSMIFNETLEDFNPILEFRAETRVRDDENDEVTVALVYDAPIKSDFNPRVETVPSRSDIEILALFGQAVAPYAGDTRETDVNPVLLAAGGMFAQIGLVQPFEEVIREGLNLDMVTIRTDIIENALADSLNPKGETGTPNQVSGLGRFLDNTSLFAGKYIGNALFVSGSVSARYFEEQRLRSIFGGLGFETSVSFELETPFFNVAWSYSPDPQVSRNFIAENTISLKWQFSY